MSTQQKSIMDEESPKIWIACLASYNAGKLVGRWVNVPETVGEMQELINEVLKNSGEPFAEEWAFHDNAYFEPFDVGEYEDLESLVKKANIINRMENIDAFRCWDFDNHDIEKLDEDEIIDAFYCEFLGVYEDEAEFAYYDMNNIHEIPKSLTFYIDYDSWWRDLNHDGYYSVTKGYKECYIFRR